MKPNIIILILTLFFSVQLTAQTLSVRVTDEQNQPVEFANVILYSLPDSVLVTGTITNERGEFSITPNGPTNGFLKVSFIGYQTRTVPATSGQTIVLKDDSQLLGEVVVSGNDVIALNDEIEYPGSVTIPMYATREGLFEFVIRNCSLALNVEGSINNREQTMMPISRKICA